MQDYTDIYFDIYFKCGGYYVNISTEGATMLPSDIFPFSYIDNNRMSFKDILKEEDISINKEYLLRTVKNMFPPRMSEDLFLNVYCRSFIDVSKKGFITLDRTDAENSRSNMYHVVSYPNVMEDFGIKGLLELDCPKFEEVLGKLGKEPVGELDLPYYFQGVKIL